MVVGSGVEKVGGYWDNPTENDPSDMNQDNPIPQSSEPTGAPVTTTGLNDFDKTVESVESVRSVQSVRTARAALAGVLAAAGALGVSELISGLFSRVPSLVARVGDVVIDNVPGSIERWAISTFGENDKPALVIGITVICLILGAVTGVLARRRFSAGWLVFGVFAFVGALAAASDPQRSAFAGWLVAIIAGLVGVGLLGWLLNRAAARSSADAVTGSPARRGFVGAAGAAAALGVFGSIGGSWLRNRQAAATEADRREVAESLSQAAGAESTTASAETEGDSTRVATSADTGQADFDDVAGITPVVVPNDDFYRIDTALVVPQIDVDSWSMKITGMVDTELELTFDDLLAMDTVEEFVTLSCVSNKVGGNLVGNARWLGVPLKALLDNAGVQPGATQLVGRSVDGWTGGFPTAYLDDPDRVAMVALAMNGEPLPIEHGFPARLVIAGLYGYVSATKWLAEVELTTLEDFDGYWIPRGWSKLGPVKTQSRIDVPNSNATVKAGRVAVAGVAWAPDRGVDQVEVEIAPVIDGGSQPGEWTVAELSADVTDTAWRQWHVGWEATPGDYMIRCRATDSTGYTQTEVRTDVAPDGATGWHTIAVRVA